MSRARVEQARWREVLSREHGAALAVICLGVWLHAADSLLVSTMMPAIVANAAGNETAAGDSLGFAATAVFLACLPPALLGLVAAARFVGSPLDRDRG